MSCGAKHHCVSHYLFRNGDLICGRAHLKKISAVTSCVCNLCHGLLGHINNVHKLVQRRILNYYLEHETVHLCLGKRISTVLLYGVLSCKNEEGLFKSSGNAHYGYGVLLHRLEKRRLGLRSCTVDLVRKDNIGEDRTGLELEGGVSVLVLYDDIGSRYVCRHKVGSELYSCEGQIEYSSQGTYKSGLSNSGNSFKKYVSSCDHCDDRSLDYFLLSYNVSSDLLENVCALCAEFLNVLFCYHDNCLFL